MKPPQGVLSSGPKLSLLDISFSQPSRRNAAQSSAPVPNRDRPEGEVVIRASDSFAPESLQRLEETALHAVDFFRRNFGPVNGQLNFEVGGAGLRAGYNPTHDTIFLPELENVRQAGLDSTDVINHEIFHALVLNAYPELPKPGEAEESELALHEALADYFAHQLSPDPYFGEQYRSDRPHLREYQSDLKLGLSPGSHAQGNAIVSLLLEHGISSGDIRDFLQGGDFRLETLARSSPSLSQALEHDSGLEISAQVSPPYTPSSSHKYWLKSEQTLELSLLPNEKLRQATSDFRIVWTSKDGYPSRHYTFEEKAGSTYAVHPNEGAKVEKVLANFYDGEKVIGFRQFYFGVRDES